MINRRRIRRLRLVDGEYALLNDVGHDYAALHYYIDRGTQRRQLVRTGFLLRDVFDVFGLVVGDAGDDSASGSLLYVAERGE